MPGSGRGGAWGELLSWTYDWLTSMDGPEVMAGQDRGQPMPRRSAGLLPFRIEDGGVLELFLVHPGGPLWANRDEHAWSIAKGEYEEGEEPSAAAEPRVRRGARSDVSPGTAD